MTRIRRCAVLLGVVAAVLFGSALPAGAGFSDSAAAPALPVGTVDVVAPGGLSADGTRCPRVWSGGREVKLLQTRLAWTPSPSPGVIGYQVMTVLTNGSRQNLAYAAGADTASLRLDKLFLAETTTVRYVVLALTPYGWYEESAVSGSTPC